GAREEEGGWATAVAGEEAAVATTDAVAGEMQRNSGGSNDRGGRGSNEGWLRLLATDGRGYGKGGCGRGDCGRGKKRMWKTTTTSK
ncbi:hypothetical protein GW17_00044098, partial [Ensete ventricosum]